MSTSIAQALECWVLSRLLLSLFFLNWNCALNRFFIRRKLPPLFSFATSRPSLTVVAPATIASNVGDAPEVAGVATV
ncbi:MAG: hypothetical protein J3R72DRAFT_437895 [Linnemannia gamsii]|nr:MAG: hypothetical protein J3R72DRAFT_437895 [Linnemannia gamsii]